jgi:hypothetical protein
LEGWVASGSLRCTGLVLSIIYVCGICCVLMLCLGFALWSVLCLGFALWSCFWLLSVIVVLWCVWL